MKVLIKDKGFTMIELMVAIVIFAIGIVGVAKMQVAAVATNSYSLQLSEALSVVQDNIENLRELDLDSTEFSVGTHNGTAVTSPEGRVFTPVWVVSSISGADAVRVAVTVTWSEKDLSYSTSLSFIKGNNL